MGQTAENLHDRLPGVTRQREIRLCAMNAPLHLRDFDIRFANGGRQDVNTRVVLPAGRCTRAVDLRGVLDLRGDRGQAGEQVGGGRRDEDGAAPQQRDERLWKRALEIHRKSVVIDGHNDITEIMVDTGYDLGTPSSATDWSLARSAMRRSTSSASRVSPARASASAATRYCARASSSTSETLNTWP